MFIRKLFKLKTKCCIFCHEDHAIGYPPSHIWYVKGFILNLCCNFDDFMEELTEEQKQKIWNKKKCN